MIKGISEKNKIIKLSVLVTVVLVLGIGGFFYFNSGEKEETVKKEPFRVNFFDSIGKEVEDIDEIGKEARFVFNKREVTGCTDQNNNIYSTKLFITDGRGNNFFNFYETDDLTFEMSYSYIEDQVLILTEFGLQDNRVVDLEGEINSETFIPPVGFGTDFIVSQDEKMIGYIENKSQVNIGSELSFDFSYLLKIKNIETEEIIEIDPKNIKHIEVEYSQFLPVGFSKDNKNFYVFASQFGMDIGYHNPNGLYVIDLATKKIEEIYYSSIEDVEEKDLLVLLGVFPEHGFALVNRGPQLSEGEKTILRTQLQKLDLKTKKFTDIYKDENNDFVGTGGKILSPDGQNIILLNEAYYDHGLSLYSLEAKSKKKLTERGEFLAWLDDSETFIYLIYTTSENTEEGIIQGIELHSLNIKTGEDYKIYTQNSLDEGTGLNNIGDKFYSFIGSF